MQTSPYSATSALLREVSERRAVARCTSVDARFTLDPSWDAPTATNYVSEKFAASGKLARAKGPCASTGFLCPLVGYRISSIELLSSATCAAATSALSRMWEARPRHSDSAMSNEQLAVQRVFDALLRESGGGSMIVYHGCSASAARSIAEHGFVKSSLRDDGYFGRGIYATPNAEYACLYASATAEGPGAVVMCRACVPSVYCVTLADYDESNAADHSKLFGQALRSEEAHFALVSPSTDYEACAAEMAEYCELWRLTGCCVVPHCRTVGSRSSRGQGDCTSACYCTHESSITARRPISQQTPNHVSPSTSYSLQKTVTVQF